MERYLHLAHLGGSLPAHGRFLAALEDPESAQRRRLAGILGHLSTTQRWGVLGARTPYEVFRDQVQPCTYGDLEEALTGQRDTGQPLVSPPCRRWQPTSGSSSRRKWIPYSAPFLGELDAATGPWLVDLARTCPGAFRGRHYWSLSWLPLELRQAGMDPDDLNLLPLWKRWALGRVMAVPPGVGRLTTSEASLEATVTLLAACPNLALLSVWSPTFGLALLQRLSQSRESIAQTLCTGRWPWPLRAPRNLRSAELLGAWDGTPSATFLKELWPDLALVSAWASGESGPQAAQLSALLPQAQFQGKGHWATEGVVTIPFQDRLPLALTSHFLEFRCLSTGRIYPAWQLEPGQEVQPLLTTSGGLVRYGLEDHMRVSGLLRRTPCLTFLGRIGGTDLVGEKLDAVAVGEMLFSLSARHSVACTTLFAVGGAAPHYCLLLEGKADPALGCALETELNTFHHYALARELGQLGPARLLGVPDALAFLGERARKRGLSLGEMKVQALEAWGLPEEPG